MKIICSTFIFVAKVNSRCKKKWWSSCEVNFKSLEGELTRVRDFQELITLPILIFASSTRREVRRL